MYRYKRKRTEAASALRILMCLWNMSGFMKQSESVAIAIVCGIAQKLNTLWFFKQRK